MKISSMFIIFFYLLPFLFQFSHSATILVDGVSKLKSPNIVHVGDSIIFNHKNRYNLYIFRSENAFNLCNFSQATLLTKPNSNSYRWYPSRPGFYYFAFNNGTQEACQSSKKLTFVVPPLPGTAIPSPEAAPETAPAPVSGGIVSSSPAFPWPFQPRLPVPPGPSPSASSPMTVPNFDKRSGIPFINSNPAVPLPTGEVDSATIRPLSTSDAGEKQVTVQLKMKAEALVFEDTKQETSVGSQTPNLVDAKIEEADRLYVHQPNVELRP